MYEILHWTTPFVINTIKQIYNFYQGLAEDFSVYLSIITHISSAVH